MVGPGGADEDTGASGVSFCSSCGARNKAGSAFCTTCGRRLGIVETRSTVTVAQPRSPTSTVAIVVFALIVLSIGAFVGFKAKQRSDVSNVVVRFIGAADSMDVNAMVDCLDPSIERGYKAVGRIASAFTKVNPVDVMELMPALFSGLQQSDASLGAMHMELVRIKDVSVRGDTATVAAEVRVSTTDEEGNPQESVETLTAKLRHFDVGWRMVE